jgi:hypothetical protein
VKKKNRPTAKNLLRQTRQTAADADARAAARPRKTGNGKGRRTPQQLARQARVYDMNVLECMTIREIAAELEISTHTVESDLRAEEALRVEHLANEKESAQKRAVDTYQNIIRRARNRGFVNAELVTTLDGALEEGGVPDPEDRAAWAEYQEKKRRRKEAAQVVEEMLVVEIKARERIDKLLGLEAATKLDPVVGDLVSVLTGGFDKR